MRDRGIHGSEYQSGRMRRHRRTDDRTIVHRGPDDGGSWIDTTARIALGNRRLAIVDLSMDGHQPMESADGRLVITYNGEVYNFQDLRTELERAGHLFRGHSTPRSSWRRSALGGSSPP